jgi:hypothetical protein
MLYQYHCACCDQVVESTHHKECTNSVHIILEVRMDSGFFVF